MRLGIDTFFETPGKGTGGLTYITSLVRALNEARGDDEVVVFASQKNRHYFEDIPDINLVELGWSNESRPRRIFTQQFLLASAARKAGCDVLVGAGNALPLLGRGIARVVVIHSLHFLFVPDQVGRITAIYRRLMVSASIRVSDRVISVSNNLRDSLEQWLPKQAHKMTTVPEAVSPRFFRDNHKGQDHFKEIHQRGGLVMLFVSTLWPYKNAEGVIRALPKTKSKKNIVLVICGGDWRGETQRLKLLARDLQVSNRLIFQGHVDQAQMPNMYASADVFIYPSLCETFGLPILEAMASGVPVIASNTTSIPEVCNGAAILVDPEDTSALASAIDVIFNDPLNAQKLIELGKARAAEMNWATTARGTFNVARRALEASK